MQYCERTHKKMRRRGMSTLVETRLDGGTSLTSLWVSCIGANSHLVILNNSADYVCNSLWSNTARVGVCTHVPGTKVPEPGISPHPRTAETIASTRTLPRSLIPQRERVGLTKCSNQERERNKRGDSVTKAKMDRPMCMCMEILKNKKDRDWRRWCLEIE